MKIFRFEVMARMLRGHFLRLLYPRGVFMRTYAGRELPDDVVGSVVVFFSLFFVCYSLLTIALMAAVVAMAAAGAAAVLALERAREAAGGRTEQLVVAVLVALAMALLIITREIDLSVAAIIALASLATGRNSHV